MTENVDTANGVVRCGGCGATVALSENGPVRHRDLPHLRDAGFAQLDGVWTCTHCWPDGTSRPDPAPRQTVRGYLVIDAHGGRGGIGYAGVDEDRAHEYARNTQSVVVELPVVGDYRAETAR